MNIRDIEEDYNLRLSAEFKAFLGVHPKGARAGKFPAWQGVIESAKAIPQIDEDGEMDWRYEVTEIFGIKSLDAFYGKTGDYEDDDGEPDELHFWDLRLVPHVYILGSTSSGDLIGQVASGEHKGSILLLNHEAYHGGTECLAHLFPSEDTREFLSENRKALKAVGYVPSFPTTDQLVAFLLQPDCEFATLLAKSFKEFYVLLCSARGVATSR